MIPTPRQQDGGAGDDRTGTPRWSQARLLARVFDLDTATCPFCRHGSLRSIGALTQEAVITRILRHLKLAAVPPPWLPPVLAKEMLDWVALTHDVARGLRDDVRAAAVCLVPERGLWALKSLPQGSRAAPPQLIRRGASGGAVSSHAVRVHTLSAAYPPVEGAGEIPGDALATWWRKHALCSSYPPVRR